MKTEAFDVGNVRVGEGLAVIAGPCVIENEAMTVGIAQTLRLISEEVRVPLIFKASYDKANRSSTRSFRGPGIEDGLRILGRVRADVGIPVVSDVHSASEVGRAAGVLDMIQIPSFLCRQTDLVVEAARTGLPLNVKKGEFLSPWDMEGIIEKADHVGNRKLVLTERGTCFGYDNLVVDLRSIRIMKGFGLPVFFDASHSMRSSIVPGQTTGFIEDLSCATVAVGVDGVFMEVHPDPSRALCDGKTSVRLDLVADLFRRLKAIWRCVTPS